ncbi:CCGSCS motif protein [Photobacterium jeanii]|nr:CCGSCS motif protein [Photobacterium jeanii]
MTFSLKKIFKKEDKDQNVKVAEQVSTAKESQENQSDTKKKGKHGESFCCGSCS